MNTTTPNTPAAVPHVHIGHYLDTQPMSPAEWGITDIRGHAMNGALIARTGAGTSTALARIASRARAAGIVVWYLDGSHLDPAVAAHAHWSTLDAEEVLERGRRRTGPGAGDSRVLVLIDHAWRVWDDHRHLHRRDAFEHLVLAGPPAGLGVLARTHTLDRSAFGTAAIRDALALPQTLLLGNIPATDHALAQDLLDGYDPDLAHRQFGTKRPPCTGVQVAGRLTHTLTLRTHLQD
ncbi:hypothetical protein ABZ234_31790 [Nocardiopsis sp. NPDC006198]|uniref:hypothetical protein n=1 Tax=Nocardiopsis sp. NPDC006198 TaxID=3154472 RepID=UPI0033AE9B7C